MTGRKKLERRVVRVRRIAIIGLVLYLPMVGTYFLPWLAILGALGAMACAAAILLAYLGLRCPQCSGELLGLVLARSQGPGFELPNDFTTCPHCGHNFEEQVDSAHLPEFLSSLERDGRFTGVVGVPGAHGVRQFELLLEGAAREAFQRVLLLHPFDSADAIGYHYFFIPPSGPVRNEELQRRMRVLVCKGDRSETVMLTGPRALTTALRWLAELEDDTSVHRIGVREGT